jgi:hypothetical protein
MMTFAPSLVRMDMWNSIPLLWQQGGLYPPWKGWLALYNKLTLAPTLFLSTCSRGPSVRKAWLSPDLINRG